MPTEVKQKFVSMYDKLVQEGFDLGIEKGREEGIDIGIDKGQEKEKIEVILRGHKEGLSLKNLSAISGLSEKEVEAILKGKFKKQA